MYDLLFRFILPMSIVASILFALVFIITPLLRRASLFLHKTSLLSICLLFVLPIPLLAGLFSANFSYEKTAAPAPLAAAYSTGKTLGNIANAAQPVQAEKPPQKVQQAPVTPKNNLPATNKPLKQSYQSLTLVQFVCVSYCLGLVIISIITISRLCLLYGFLRKNSVIIKDDAILQQYASICEKLEIKRKPALLQSNCIKTPVIAGVLRPKIILPSNICGKTITSFALQHELVHYKNHDLIFKFLMAFVGILHWFNPFAHLLRYNFANACEECCDDAVTKTFSSNEKFAYANSLLNFAQGKAPYALSCFASPKKQLKQRLKMLINPKKSTKKFRIFSGAVLTLLVSSIVLTGCSMSAGATSSSSSALDETLVVSSTHNSGSSSIPTTSSSSPNSEKLSSSSFPNSTPTSALLEESSLSTAIILSETKIAENTSPQGFLRPVTSDDCNRSSRGFAGGGHRGKDFNAAEGTAIYASKKGTVLTSESHSNYGNYVEIEHEDGYKTLYAHCSELLVEKGDEVEQGQQIAKMGATGNTTGTLCHFEVSQNDTLLNPDDYLLNFEGGAN